MKKIAEIKKSGSNKECDNGIYKIVKQMKRDNKDFFWQKVCFRWQRESCFVTMVKTNAWEKHNCLKT